MARSAKPIVILAANFSHLIDHFLALCVILNSHRGFRSSAVELASDEKRPQRFSAIDDEICGQAWG
jgi:hypothetical protein